MKAIKNVRIYDYENYIENGYVIFDDKIEEVGKMEHFKFTGQILDGKGKLLIPGLVNSHTHCYSTLSRGKEFSEKADSFSEMLKNKWWKFDENLRLNEIHYSALINGIESIKSGVTTLIDHHASGEIEGSLEVIKTALVDKLKMRSILCFETSDRFDVNMAIEENLNMLKNHENNYTGQFGLHASLSLSDETLKKVSKVLDGRSIHVHVAESLEDEDRSLYSYNRRVVERFDEFKLINDGSILAHCVHIDESEAEILQDKNVYIALNPSSNLNNNVGLFNYRMLSDHKLKIILGTDGLSTNIAKEWFNLYLLIKKSLDSREGVKLDKIIEYINNSYELVSNKLNIKLGKIRKGFAADFLLIDYKPPTKMDLNNAFAHILFSVFQNIRPSDVFIAGHRVLSHYETGLDEEKIFNEARNEANNLWKRIGD